MAIRNEEDLAEEIKNEKDTIEIEGDLANKIIKIRATGNVAWAIAVGAIGITAGAAYVTLTPSPDPVTKGFVPATGIAAGGAAIAILGVSTTTAAIALVRAAGSISVLNKLRSYKVLDQGTDRIVLKRSK